MKDITCLVVCAAMRVAVCVAMYVAACVAMYVAAYVAACAAACVAACPFRDLHNLGSPYGVATVSRIDKITGLFRRILSLL